MDTEGTSREVGSHASLGLDPERAAFEAHMDATAPLHWRTTAHAREAWALWHACWPQARAAIYSAEQAQIEAPLRAEIERLRVALEELRDRIKEHPAYAELTEQQEIDTGGDTAELSYLARVADAALGA